MTFTNYNLFKGRLTNTVIGRQYGDVAMMEDGYTSYEFYVQSSQC